MRLSLHELYTTFRERTVWTNDIIGDGYSSRLGVLEETITDVNLIEINRKHSAYVLTKKFSRREEGSKSGADWLWCIGEPGAWFPFLVQAKVVNPDTSNCRALNYRAGEQRRLLLDFSRRHRLFPLYCVYSKISDNFLPLSKSMSCLADIDSQEWACALIIPKFIRQLVNQRRKKQTDLLQYGVPWTFPFRYAAQNESHLLAHSLANAMQEVVDELDSPAKTVVNTASSSKSSIKRTTRIQWENPNPSILITSDLPNIVTRLIKGRINPVRSPVAGISIVSCVPVKTAISVQKTLPAAREAFQSVNNPETQQIDSDPLAAT